MDNFNTWDSTADQWNIYIYIYIYMEWDIPVTDRAKVKPNMADMEALSYVGFSPPAQYLLYT